MLGVVMFLIFLIFLIFLGRMLLLSYIFLWFYTGVSSDSGESIQWPGSSETDETVTISCVRTDTTVN